MSNAEINDKQKRFVEEFLTDLNATQAAIRAGYSKKGAENTGWRLLRNPRVREFLELQRMQRAREMQTTVDNVLRELWFLYERAWMTGKLSVARGCLSDLGKHAGVYIDRQLIVSQNVYENMTENELGHAWAEMNEQHVELIRDDPEAAHEELERLRHAGYDIPETALDRAAAAGDWGDDQAPVGKRKPRRTVIQGATPSTPFADQIGKPSESS